MSEQPASTGAGGGRSRRAFLAAAGAAGATGLAGCVGGLGASPASVRLLLDWKANATHAGPFVAAQEGFDEDEGVDIEIVPGSGGATTAEQVGLEKYELGLTSASAVLGTRSGDVAVRSYAAAQQGPNSVVYTVAEQFGGTLDAPADLDGKTIAAVPSSSNIALLKAILARAGVLESVEFLNVGWGGLTSAVLSGNADAALGAFPDGIALGNEGYDASMLWIADHVPTTGRLVVANPAFADANGDALRGVLRAVARGWARAANDPEAAMDLLVEAEPRLSSGRELGIQKIKGTVANLLLTDAVREHGWGYQSASAWRSTAETLVDAGFVPESVDVSAAWTNDYRDTEDASVGAFADQVSAPYADDWSA